MAGCQSLQSVRRCFVGRAPFFCTVFSTIRANRCIDHSQHGKTALRVAAELGKVSCVQGLLDMGADATFQDVRRSPSAPIPFRHLIMPVASAGFRVHFCRPQCPSHRHFHDHYARTAESRRRGQWSCGCRLRQSAPGPQLVPADDGARPSLSFPASWAGRPWQLNLSSLPSSLHCISARASNSINLFIMHVWCSAEAIRART